MRMNGTRTTVRGGRATSSSTATRPTRVHVYGVQLWVEPPPSVIGAYNPIDANFQFSFSFSFCLREGLSVDHIMLVISGLCQAFIYSLQLHFCMLVKVDLTFQFIQHWIHRKSILYYIFCPSSNAICRKYNYYLKQSYRHYEFYETKINKA